MIFDEIALDIPYYLIISLVEVHLKIILLFTEGCTYFTSELNKSNGKNAKLYHSDHDLRLV